MWPVRRAPHPTNTRVPCGKNRLGTPVVLRLGNGRMDVLCRREYMKILNRIDISWFLNAVKLSQTRSFKHASGAQLGPARG